MDMLEKLLLRRQEYLRRYWTQSQTPPLRLCRYMYVTCRTILRSQNPVQNMHLRKRDTAGRISY